eukprot:646011-Amphidinium_carterae.1
MPEVWPGKGLLASLPQRLCSSCFLSIVRNYTLCVARRDTKGRCSCTCLEVNPHDLPVPATTVKPFLVANMLVQFKLFPCWTRCNARPVGPCRKAFVLACEESKHSCKIVLQNAWPRVQWTTCAT